MDTRIPRCKVYRTSANKEELMKRELRSLQQKGMIIPSDSCYGSPCVIKEKVNGEDRLLIDFRALNKITKEIQAHFPGPTRSFIECTIQNFSLSSTHNEDSTKQKYKNRVKSTLPLPLNLGGLNSREHLLDS